MRGTGGLAWVVVVAIGVAGCGGDTADPAADGAGGDGSATSAAGAPTDELSGEATGDGSAADALDGMTFAIDQSFWHSGFLVTLGNGVVEAQRDVLDEVTGYLLKIEATFENQGDESGWMGGEVAIVQGSGGYAPSPVVVAPDVGGGLAADGEFVFVIDEQFDPDQAVLVVGSADQQRAEVPLAAGAGELVDLPPEDLELAGTLSMDLLDLEIVGAEFRHDIPATFGQAPSGKRALTLDLVATSRKSGNWQVFAEWFSLTGPDGVAVPADGAELGSLPGNDDGLVTDGLYLRFLVDEDASGPHTLTLVPADYWIESGPAEASVEFALG